MTEWDVRRVIAVCAAGIITGVGLNYLDMVGAINQPEFGLGGLILTGVGTLATYALVDNSRWGDRIMGRGENRQSET